MLPRIDWPKAQRHPHETLPRFTQLAEV